MTQPTVDCPSWTLSLLSFWRWEAWDLYAISTTATILAEPYDVRLMFYVRPMLVEGAPLLLALLWPNLSPLNDAKFVDEGGTYGKCQGSFLAGFSLAVDWWRPSSWSLFTPKKHKMRGWNDPDELIGDITISHTTSPCPKWCNHQILLPAFSLE